MAHPNEDLMRKGFAAFSSGDMATLNDLFADDIEWHTPGESQIAGDYHGKDEVFGAFAKVVELTGGTFKIDLHDVLANDDHGVALLTVTGQQDGRELHDNSVQVFHIKDGKVTESWIHPGDERASDEFWG
jgi:ketosteroid isomerase-like protein